MATASRWGHAEPRRIGRPTRDAPPTIHLRAARKGCRSSVKWHGDRFQFKQGMVIQATEGEAEITTSAPWVYGLVIEADGVLMNSHIDAHRAAFNKVFQEIGHDCTNWGPTVYWDLVCAPQSFIGPAAPLHSSAGPRSGKHRFTPFHNPIAAAPPGRRHRPWPGENLL